MLWGGRFTQEAADVLRALNDSLSFDRRLYAEDIVGSLAYAEALVQAGILTGVEAESIRQGLEAVRLEIEQGVFKAQPGDEDIHTAVERRLIELIGSVGGKLHTARSRNDQVSTDLRLWVMKVGRQVDSQLAVFQDALVARAETTFDWLMPGYTHLQPAQAITVGHWLMSYFWMVARDRERLRDALKRTATLPLGSGALAGTPLQIGREKLAQDLGFERISQNSLDAVSDRDFVAEVAFTLSLLSIHMSRLAEDVIIFSTPQFGFVMMDERYSTGSSLMPQKRNADSMELMRGKSSRLIGNLTALLTMMKGLPSGYNKDLQEDKEALFDSVDTIGRLLPVLVAVVESLTFNRERLRDSLTQDMLATDLAEYLVAQGMPFREAHGIVGSIVNWVSEQRIALSEVPIDTLQGFSALFQSDVYDWLTFEESVARRASPGGTAPQAVKTQIDEARAWLARFSQR